MEFGEHHSHYEENFNVSFLCIFLPFNFMLLLTVHLSIALRSDCRTETSFFYDSESTFLRHPRISSPRAGPPGKNRGPARKTGYFVFVAFAHERSILIGFYN
jgi:hypothetical protein